MASTGFISRAAITGLWTLALWHSWECRGLFIDGAKLLVDIAQNQDLILIRDARRHAEVASQLLVLAGIKAGIIDLHRLAQLLSLDLFGLPTIFYSIALWRTRNEPVLLAAVLAAIAIVFMSTSFFIIGEFNTTYALTVLSAAWIVTTDRLRIAEGVFLLAIAVFFCRSYEVTLYLGPLLAGLTVWRVLTVTQRPPVATVPYLAAAGFFLYGMMVAVGQLRDPFDPNRVNDAYQQAPFFWWNLQFDLVMAAALAVLAWGIARPESLRTRAPFLAGAVLAALLALSPLLALFDTMFRPLARSHYVARTAGGVVIAAIVLFVWTYSAEFHRRLPILVMLRRPDVARRLLAFTSILALATVPADIFLTATWMHYLDALKSVVRGNVGVVAIEDTKLSHRPDLLLVEHWAMPSQSVVVRSRPGDAVVAPFRWYNDWMPFPPDKVPDIGKYLWRD